VPRKPWGPPRAGAESEARGLERPLEASVYTDVDSDVRDVPCELCRFFTTSTVERYRNRRVAVDATLDVERSFAVSDQDAYRHPANLPAADAAQAHHGALGRC
jgi:hypothetical protein